MTISYYPKTLIESNLGVYYISPAISLKVDKELKSIWIDLDTKISFFKTKKNGAFNFPIIRASIGSNSDFKLSLDKKILNMIIFLSKKIPWPIPNLIELILNPNLIEGQENTEKIINLIKNQTVDFSDLDKKILSDFGKFISGLPKESLNKLLSENKYSLVFGNLNQNEEMENRTSSEISQFKSFPNVTGEDLDKYFGNIILDFNLIKKTYVGINLPEILRGEVPKRGGVILLDQGGTGKSMIKFGLAKFWKEVLGGEVKEKKTGDISSYVNAAPQLIQTWYRGGVMQGFEDKLPPEIDLVAAARNNEVPSLIIIDEAEEFILEDKGYIGKKPIEGSTTSLKRFIQEIDKGGVTGAVVTLLIANMNEEEIHQPIVQGSERLKAIYIGPPRNIFLWEKISKIGFRKIKFKDKINFKLISELIYYHNETLGKFNGKYYEFEFLCISPRRFLGYVDDYLEIHGSDKNDLNDNKSFLFSIRNKVFSKNLHFKKFVENFIEEVLIDKLNSSQLNSNEKKEIINKYYNLFNLTDIKEEKKELNKNKIEKKEEIKNNFEEVKKSIDNLIKIYNFLFKKITDNTNQSENFDKVKNLIFNNLGILERDYINYLMHKNNNKLPSTFNEKDFTDNLKTSRELFGKIIYSKEKVFVNLENPFRKLIEILRNYE